METSAATAEQHPGRDDPAGDAGRRLTVVPFEPEHVGRVKLQEVQRQELVGLNPDYSTITGMALTGLTPAGEPVICAGLVELWPNRATVWALLGQDAGPWMGDITRKVRAFLGLQSYRRIELDVMEGFEAGRRWARLLGFTFEGSRRAYYPGGQGCDSFVRIR